MDRDGRVDLLAGPARPASAAGGQGEGTRDEAGQPQDTSLCRGGIVVLSLVNPREKFWGAVLSITPSGIVLRGLDLGSFDGAVSMICNEEQSAAIEVFFPMHRVERMEADGDTSGIPSLQQRFERATGQDAKQFLGCRK